jgi:hypothetical protein
MILKCTILQNLAWSPYSVKRALMNSCSPLEDQCSFGQGHGLLNIEAAWAHLSAHAAAPERDVRFVVSCNGKASKGIHLRGVQATRAAEYAVKVEPVFLDADNRPAKVKTIAYSFILHVSIFLQFLSCSLRYIGNLAFVYNILYET